MRLKLFSVRDDRANCFLAPFVARAEIDAKRQITAGFSNPQMKETPVGQHPEDFSLYQLAAFDDETGHFSECAPIHIATIASLLPTSTVPS